VVHTHPALINGITCGKNGRKIVEKLFGAEAIWIPSINPGYILALAVRDDAAAFEKYHGKKVQIIFLENHGVFVAADRVFLINKIYADIVSRIAPRVKRVADMSYAFDTHADGNGMDTGIIAKTLTKDTGLVVKFLRNNEILRVTESASTFKTALGGAFTPDHIVYAGSKFLYSDTVQDVVYVVKDFISANSCNPKILAVHNFGVFGLGGTEKEAQLALELFCDALRVSVYSESFGGQKFMSKAQVDFIDNWEVEKFRASV
jgi:rhamnose utilization protein RhaD (predicted bifunctional aldolase and dehydrogenase)